MISLMNWQVCMIFIMQNPPVVEQVNVIKLVTCTKEKKKKDSKGGHFQFMLP